MFVAGVEPKWRRNASEKKGASRTTSQQDELPAQLTVREHLLYVAHFSGEHSAEQRQLEVNRVLTDLSLSHVADSRIGGEGRRG